LFIALAPVAYVYDIPSDDVQTLAETQAVEDLLTKGFLEFLPYGRVSSVAPTICQMSPELCTEFFDAVMGPSTNLNETRYQVSNFLIL
jgi:hypothetical protein